MAHPAPAFAGDVSVGVSLALKQLYVRSWCGCNVEERKKGEKKKSFCHSSLLFKQIKGVSDCPSHSDNNLAALSSCAVSVCHSLPR